MEVCRKTNEQGVRGPHRLCACVQPMQEESMDLDWK